jgi:hypothetical protein
MKQNHKTHVLALLIISLGVVIPILVAAEMMHSCVQKDWTNESCYFLNKDIFFPIFLSFITLLLTTLGLFFVRRETFIAWAIFASIGFPLMLGILLYTFNNKPAMGGWVGGPTDDQFASVLLPGLFIIISLVIIAMKSAGPEKK